MIHQFPNIAPAARAWAPWTRPVQIFTALSGHETRISHGSGSIGASLSLTFSNILNGPLTELMDHFSAAGGTLQAFRLSANNVAGIADPLNARLLGGLWRYSSQPSVQWTAPGIATVSVELVSTLD